MASLANTRALFFPTSPRSPFKTRPEIRLLTEGLAGEVWNSVTQERYLRALAASPFFEGEIGRDPALQARDRVTRAPKALGLVDLEPTVRLTPAGAAYLDGRRPHEAFTRQLLKFQLPSPYHTDRTGRFGVRPYLELLRLTADLDGLSSDEIAAYGLQLTHVDRYDDVRRQILAFRREVATAGTGRYRAVWHEAFARAAQAVYAEQWTTGDFGTRQSTTASADEFIAKKRRNHRDYADAAIRYLRETRLVALRNPRSKRIRVVDERAREVEYILANTPRQPLAFPSTAEFKQYLFNPARPALLEDDRALVAAEVARYGSPAEVTAARQLSIEPLRDLRDQILDSRLAARIAAQAVELRAYREFDDIVATFDELATRRVENAPLTLEWNTWRALSMLNDGQIVANLRFDDAGAPLFTAPAGKPDILCSYRDFDLLTEVTMSAGATQYDMEGEPVARHVGDHVRATGRDTYCLFVAPRLNPAAVAHFFVLHRVRVAHYGGLTRVIPLDLEDLRRMLADAHRAPMRPTALQIRAFVNAAAGAALTAEDEMAWRTDIQRLADSWADT